MKLIAYDINKINNIGNYKNSENMRLINEFVESDMDCVKVEGWTHAHANSCANSFVQTLKRMKKSGIEVVSRKGEVYLIKKNKTK